MAEWGGRKWLKGRGRRGGREGKKKVRGVEVGGREST